MRRLVDQDPAAFTFPGPAPRVAGIICHVPPSVHVDGPEDRASDLPFIDRFADPHGGREETPLADRRPGGMVRFSRFQNGIAVLQRGSERFFDRDIGSEAQRLNGCLPVDRMRGADADDIQSAFFDHGFDGRIGFYVVFLCESFGPVFLYIIDRAEFAVFDLLISGCMEGPDFSAPDDTRSDGFFHISILS